MLRRFVVEWLVVLVVGIVAVGIAYAAGTYLIMTAMILVCLWGLRMCVRDIQRFRQKR